MKRILFAAVLFAAPGIGAAEDFSYDYLNIGYGVIEFDDFDVDGDGIGIDGSLAIADNYHLFAMYEMGDFDFDVESTAYNFGIGYNTSVSEAVDLVARLSYEYVEVDAPLISSVDDNGFGLSAGLRFAATEKLELNGGLEYIDLSDSGDDTGFNAAALYNFNDMFSVTVRGDWTGDVSTYTFGGRFYFGQ